MEALSTRSLKLRSKQPSFNDLSFLCPLKAWAERKTFMSPRLTHEDCMFNPLQIAPSRCLCQIIRALLLSCCHEASIFSCLVISVYRRMLLRHQHSLLVMSASEESCLMFPNAIKLASCSGFFSSTKLAVVEPRSILSVIRPFLLPNPVVIVAVLRTTKYPSDIVPLDRFPI